VKYVALCHTCGHRHDIEFDHTKGPPPPHAFSDWYTKHPHPHATEFRFPRRRQRDMRARLPDRSRWQDYLHNADVKTAYAASAAATITLASLAASSSLLGGRESTAIDNGASVKYLDYLAAGNYRAAASNNQAGSIYTCVVGARDDTPSWPDVFDGTDSAETVTDAGTFNSICKIISIVSADNTASQTWYWGPVSVAEWFGGWVPDQFVYFVTHNIQTTTNVWSATEGDHSLKHTPVYAVVA
jgi:hypothetical protein